MMRMRCPSIDSKGKGKAVSKLMKSHVRARSAFFKSDDEGYDINISGSDSDDNNDMSDFIVESDEDEEEKDAVAFSRNVMERNGIMSSWILTTSLKPWKRKKLYLVFARKSLFRRRR